MVDSSSPPSPLVSFVPGPVVRRLFGDDGPLGDPCVQRVAGAVLFADISGFTPLAERLGSRGARGTEELTELLNRTFGRLIDQIEQYGGEVVKFAGDALLAIWEDPDEATATLRAAQCGLALHGVAAQGAGESAVDLTLRIGVGAGTVDMLFVAGARDRWECVPAGSPLRQIATAERHAGPGETVLSAPAWSLVADRCSGAPRGLGCALLRSVNAPPSGRRARSRPARVDDDALKPFVARSVRDRVTAGHADWLSELRRVTVLFIRLDDAEAEDAALLERTQATFRTLTRILEGVRAAVDKLSVDDKGMIALAVLGLPPFSHQDDPLRGVSAALRLREALADQGTRADIGIATGRVFCGVVGNAVRREYTVIGDTVNLASRLMQQAQGMRQAGGGILCDAATRLAAGDRIDFEPPRTLRLKGKAEPVQAFQPTARAGPSRPTAAVAGRREEHAAFVEALDDLREGRSRFLVLEGGAGMGKSQLVTELRAMARAREIPCLAGAGDPVERATPYFAWRGIFSHILGLDGIDPADARALRDHVARRVVGDPLLERLAPLLRNVIDVDIEDTELTAAMQGEVRAFNTQDVLVHLLRQAGGGDGASRALALVIEDGQWLDSASWGLLRQVVKSVEPLLVVLASRPVEEPFPPAFAELVGRSDTRRIRLAPLTLEDTTHLLTQRLGAPPTEELTQAIFRRAEGNPFFTGELAVALQERGIVAVEDGRARLVEDAAGAAALTLPDTMQAVILARLDRLEPGHQLMLKVASVIGRSFAFTVLRAIYPVAQDRPLLRTKCDELVQIDLTELHQPDPDPIWLYRQEATREVAYDLLLFAQRRQLHRAVAETLEAHGGERLQRLAPLLAWHWDRADHPERTLPYLEMAGDQAVREGAYQEGERAFRRALELLDEHPGLVPAEQADVRRAHWERQRGEALLGLGRLPESRAALERAVALLGFPVPASMPAVGLNLLGGVVRQLRYRLPGTRASSLSAERAAIHAEAALAYLRLIETYFFLAGPAQTLDAALRALNIAEAAGPSPELARAYTLTGWIVSMIPQFALADLYLGLAADLVATPEGRAARQPVRFFTGFTRAATGRWEEGRQALEEAIELAERIGDKRRWIEAVCGLSSPLHYQGEYERRVALGCDVLYAAARRQGDFQAESWGILDQLESLTALGDVARTAPLLDDLEPFLEHDIGRSEQVWGHGLLAMGRFQQGRLDDAWRAAVRCNQAAGSMAPVAVYVFEGHAGAAEVLLALTEATWAGVAPGPLRTELDRACKQLERYARVFPFARSRALSCRGRQRALEGRRGAMRLLRASVEAAVRVQMPLEEGIARLALGRAVDDGAERARAAAIFERLGASLWLARARPDPSVPSSSVHAPSVRLG